LHGEWKELEVKSDALSLPYSYGEASYAQRLVEKD